MNPDQALLNRVVRTIKAEFEGFNVEILDPNTIIVQFPPYHMTHTGTLYFSVEVTQHFK